MAKNLLACNFVAHSRFSNRGTKTIIEKLMKIHGAKWNIEIEAEAVKNPGLGLL